MIYDYLTINFAPISGLLFLTIFLLANSNLEQKIKKIFFLLIGLEYVEIASFSLELWTSTFEKYTAWRTLWSAIGYSVRPILLYLIFLLAARNSKNTFFKKVLTIPLVLNILAAFSAFFTDLVYAYTPDNLFIRGPLGYCFTFVLGFYLICTLNMVLKDIQKPKKLEAVIIFAMFLLLTVSTLVETLHAVRTLGRSAMVMSTIFYYMFFQTRVYHTNMRDGLLARLSLERENRIDGATGVLNKKFFVEEAKEMLKTSQGESVAFIFLDLDHLKDLNDTFGHAMGDIAILDAAGKILTAFDGEDLIGRFGGDEFCVMLTHISKDVLEAYLIQALKMLRATYSAGDTELSVTASIGAAYVSSNQNLEYETIMQAADLAVYEAKHNGRNRYVLKDLS